MTKCSECGKDVVEYTGYWARWHKLYNFLGFLYNEETITQATYDEMTQELLYIKTAVVEADDVLVARETKCKDGI